MLCVPFFRSVCAHTVAMFSDRTLGVGGVAKWGCSMKAPGWSSGCFWLYPDTDNKTYDIPLNVLTRHILGVFDDGNNSLSFLPAQSSQILNSFFYHRHPVRYFGGMAEWCRVFREDVNKTAAT